MKIIFLDIDGVLNSHRFFKERHEKNAERHFNGDYIEYKLGDIDLKSMVHLNDLLQKTGAKIVVSSTWRKSFSVKQLQELFRRVNLQGEIIDKTATLNTIRGLEIAKWLETRPEVESFVIIDDDSDMGDLKRFLVKTTFDDGITEDTVAKAVALLGVPRNSVGPCKDDQTNENA